MAATRGSPTVAPPLALTTPDDVEPTTPGGGAPADACALASWLAKSVDMPELVAAVPVEKEAPVVPDVPVAPDVAELPASDAGSRICCWSWRIWSMRPTTALILTGTHIGGTGEDLEPVSRPVAGLRPGLESRACRSPAPTSPRRPTNCWSRATGCTWPPTGPSWPSWRRRRSARR